MSKHYLGRAGRLLLAASTISGITLLSALAADAQTAPSAGTEIQNQATAEFTDDSDPNGTSTKIVSDTVKVTVAEVAGITGTSAVTTANVYRTKVVNFDFKITNAGNDPTKFFIPGTVSKAIYENASNAGVAIPTTNIGKLSLVAYKADGSSTEVAIADSPTKSNEIPLTGASTGSIAALINSTNAAIQNNGGSIKPGGYVVIRVPVTIPANAKTNTDVEITLGNTATTPGDNQAYVAGGVNSGNNDLYTVDNTNTDNGDAASTGPANGEKETSMVQKALVQAPGTVTISGTVYDDRNNSGAPANGGTIFTNGEFGTNGVFGTGTVKVKAVLINADTGAILDSKIVDDGTGNTTKGAYTFTAPAITKVKVILVKETDTGTTPALPDTWVKTAEISREFTTDLAAIPNQDFGIRQKGKLILLKRITKIGGTATATDDTTDTKNGNNASGAGTNWPSGFIKGKVDAGQVQPGEQIEYTIYFLNNQGADVTKARICDQIKGVQTYEADSMKLGLRGATTVAESPLTDAVDTTTDKANTFTATATGITGCNLIPGSTSTTATDPGVLVDIAGSGTNIPSAKPDPTPNDPNQVTYPAGSYGYFRFTTKVNGTTPGSTSSSSTVIQ